MFCLVQLINTYGDKQVQASVITDRNCDHVASDCTCNKGSSYRSCTPADVGY